MDTVLVTGGSGRLGPYVINKLSKDSVVRNFDLVAPEAPSGTFLQGSVLDLHALLAEDAR